MVVEGNFVRLFLFVFLLPSSLTHCAFSWERLMTFLEILDWVQRFEILRQVQAIEQKGAKQYCKYSSSCWVVDSLLLS